MTQCGHNKKVKKKVKKILWTVVLLFWLLAWGRKAASWNTTSWLVPASILVWGSCAPWTLLNFFTVPNVFICSVPWQVQRCCCPQEWGQCCTEELLSPPSDPTSDIRISIRGSQWVSAQTEHLLFYLAVPSNLAFNTPQAFNYFLVIADFSNCLESSERKKVSFRFFF